MNEQSLTQPFPRFLALLFATCAGDSAGLQPWLKDAAINRDRNLRLQYLAGLDSTGFQQVSIYADIVRHRRLPGAIFSGSREWLDALRGRINAVERAREQLQSDAAR